MVYEWARGSRWKVEGEFCCFYGTLEYVVKSIIWLKMTIIVKSNRESQKHVIEDDYYSEK
jgi:hypothetical protein